MVTKGKGNVCSVAAILLPRADQALNVAFLHTPPLEKSKWIFCKKVAFFFFFVGLIQMASSPLPPPPPPISPLTSSPILRVMRLYAPPLQPFTPCPLLHLPDCFGVIHVGEEFKAFVGVVNASSKVGTLA